MGWRLWAGEGAGRRLSAGGAAGRWRRRVRGAGRACECATRLTSSAVFCRRASPCGGSLRSAARAAATASPRARETPASSSAAARSSALCSRSTGSCSATASACVDAAASAAQPWPRSCEAWATRASAPSTRHGSATLGEAFSSAQPSRSPAGEAEAEAALRSRPAGPEAAPRDATGAKGVYSASAAGSAVRGGDSGLRRPRPRLSGVANLRGLALGRGASPCTAPSAPSTSSAPPAPPSSALCRASPD